MNEGLIPKRYAKALYKFACEKGADLGLYRLMATSVGVLPTILPWIQLSPIPLWETMRKSAC